MINYSIFTEGIETPTKCRGIIRSDRTDFQFRINKWNMVLTNKDIIVKSYPKFPNFLSKIFGSPEIIFIWSGKEKMIFSPPGDFTAVNEKRVTLAGTGNNASGEYLYPSLGNMKISCLDRIARSDYLDEDGFITAICIFITKWSYWNRNFFS